MVVVGEPTNLRYLGHRGRAEYALTFAAVQEHAGHTDREGSAIVPGGQGDRRAVRLETLDHPVLRPGMLAITRVQAAGDPKASYPSRCDVYVDRRLTLGEDAWKELERIQAVVARHGGRAKLPELDELTETGPRLSGPLVFPGWLADSGSPHVRALLSAAEATLGRSVETGVWRFSTNGTSWAGEAGIPTVGFGPGDERLAHTPLDRVSRTHVRAAAETYARIPAGFGLRPAEAADPPAPQQVRPIEARCSAKG